MLLSTSVDTVLGDVFAETTSASETIAAEPHQGFMTFMRGHPGGHSTSRSQAEAATASALAQSAAARSGLLTNLACTGGPRHLPACLTQGTQHAYNSHVPFSFCLPPGADTNLARQPSP